MHVEGVTTRLPSLSEAKEARSDFDTLAERRNNQIIRFGLGDNIPLAVFLRTYVAAVRQDLDVSDDHVTYDLTVNYLAGTMYHAHLHEAGRDGPGKSITNLYAQFLSMG